MTAALLAVYQLAAVWHGFPGQANPGPSQPPPGVGDKVAMVMGWVKWGGLSACVVGLMVLGAMLWVHHRRGDGQSVGGIGFVLGGVILIGAASGIVGALAQ